MAYDSGRDQLPVRLTHRIKAHLPGGTTVSLPCRPMTLRVAETEEAGTQVPVGSLQLLINRHASANTDWRVDFENQRYGVIGVIPFLRQRLPKRQVLICAPEYV